MAWYDYRVLGGARLRTEPGSWFAECWWHSPQRLFREVDARSYEISCFVLAFSAKGGWGDDAVGNKMSNRQMWRLSSAVGQQDLQGKWGEW